ncbi:MAG: PAS domain S-box protein [Rhodospirillales bacterium]|nr:PAS domain S-box protein [Rhodospirillales bacterium]
MNPFLVHRSGNQQAARNGRPATSKWAFGTAATAGLATAWTWTVTDKRGTDLVNRTGNALVFAATVPEPAFDTAAVTAGDVSTSRSWIASAAPAVIATAFIASVIGALAYATLCAPVMRRLRRDERRFRQVFESMNSAAAVFRAAAGTRTFTLVSVNQEALRLDGLADDPGSPLRSQAEFPSLAHERLVEALEQVWRSGQSERLVACLSSVKTPSASTWREYHVFKLPSAEVACLYEDISFRKRAEESLKESEERWRSIIETSAIAIVIVDAKHDIRFVNKAAEALFGYPAQDLIGAPFGFPLVQDDVAEIDIIRPGRSIAYGEMRVVPMRWGGQNNSLLFVQDVSAHRRTEGDLRKLFQAIEQSPASVMITNIAGRIEYVNPKFTESTGYTYPEVVGKTPAFLQSGYTSSREYSELWKTISAGGVWRGEFSNRCKNGDVLWELASIAPVRDGRGNVTHYVAVKEDITERKATEERLRRSQRMEMIGQLTGGIAHDFNNLLGIVLGNLQLLEENTALDPESRELINDAIWSAERGAQLTHRLLAFARRQRLNPRATDLNHVVAEMAGLLRRTLGDRINVREDLKANVWETMIDRGQLESALLNLVVNARDAMPNGGDLIISTGTAVLPQDIETKGEDVTAGDYAVLAVTDTGTGMPPEIVERIFEPFFTTKKFGEGSGLGLSMVYGFVRQSGGHIAVESEVGHGSVVRLFLPRSNHQNDTDLQSMGGTKTNGGGSIAVVTKDASVRDRTRVALRREGHEVLEAVDFASVLALVDHAACLDLVLVDTLAFEGLSAADLAHEIHHRRPDVAIVMAAPQDVCESIKAVGLAGRVEYLMVPYQDSELTVLIRVLLAEKAR